MDNAFEAEIIEEALKYTPDRNTAELLAKKTIADISPLPTASDTAFVIAKAQLAQNYNAYRAGNSINSLTTETNEADINTASVLSAPQNNTEAANRLAEETKYDPEKSTLWIPKAVSGSAEICRIARDVPDASASRNNEKAEENRSVMHSMINSMLVVGVFAAIIYMLWQGGLFNVFFR